MQTDKRIIQLEEQSAFIDQTLRELTNSINSLYQEQLILKRDISNLTNQIIKLQNTLENNDIPLNEQIPPHY